MKCGAFFDIASPMFTASAKFYDLIYKAFKDYESEAETLAGILRTVNPIASHVLDVGCGTAEHARILTERFGYKVDGLDLNADLVNIAKEKLPTAKVFVADMVEFELPHKYDAIICMFSSIAYVRTLVNLTQTLLRFSAHLAYGGVIVVEPWFEPEAFVAGNLILNHAEFGETKVCRMGTSTIEDRISRIQFEYLIGTSAEIHHATEVHELGLFTTAETLECFRSAGLNAVHDPIGPSGRGIYIAQTK